MAQKFYIHTYTTLKLFVENIFSFEVARLEKGLKNISLLKMSSEMNSTHPFYPILIANTPYVIVLPHIVFSQKSFLIKAKKS